MSEEQKAGLEAMSDQDDKEIAELRAKRRDSGRGGPYAREVGPDTPQLDIEALREQDPQTAPRFRMVNTVGEGPDPSEINITRRVKLTGKMPTWLFWAIAAVIGLGFPIAIFFSMMAGK